MPLLLPEKAMSKVRGIAFWSLDAIQGGVVKKAYQELKKFDAMDSRSRWLSDYQKSALRKLLNHSKDTTKFYGNIHGIDLNNYPIVNKNIIRPKQDDFISSKYRKSDLIKMYTSGSTGIPFICYQNSEKKKRVNAEVIYYSGKVGYSLGRKLIYLRAVTRDKYKSKLLQWIQNETFIDVTNLNDKHIENILNQIDKVSRAGSMIKCYSSTLDALHDYCGRKGIYAVGKGGVYGVVSGAEMLFDDIRNDITKIFQCHCYSRYSNQENGVIGQDDTENNVFILNEAHYIVEIFKMDADELGKEGELGRIVVTDLYNFAMPMIRYDTGDIGSVAFVKRNGVNKRAITNFGGRRVDMIYDCKGNLLSPHIITNNFWQFPEIEQYQFIQESKMEYTVKINTEREFFIREEIKALLKKLLGDNASINIETVEEIPVLASGKRKYIVNKMLSNTKYN